MEVCNSYISVCCVCVVCGGGVWADLSTYSARSGAFSESTLRARSTTVNIADGEPSISTQEPARSQLCHPPYEKCDYSKRFEIALD